MNILQEERIIKAGSAIDEQGKQRFLSNIEGFDDLPDNCHFNKVLTGCGGTTVALKNDVKYVIAAPTKGIGENKQRWADEYKANICVIDGDSLDDDGEKGKEARIKKATDYIKEGGKKIVVTYDSLPNIVAALEDKVKDWKLLVDESHMLLEAGSYRCGAIYDILNNMNKFKSYCLMTATPVRDKYQLPALANIPKIKVEWENIETVNIERRTSKKNIDDYSALLVLDYLIQGEGDLSNAHIFLNSVTSITAIVRKVKKAYKGVNLANQIKIVTANTSENRAKLKNDLGIAYKIGCTTDIAKKINFYTSTAFSGQDIFDKNAVSYVIVDGRKDYTKVDITTTIPQIIGRIRDAKVKNKLVMMYSADEFDKYLDRDTYEAQVFTQLVKAKDTVEDYKHVAANTKKILRNAVSTDEYFHYRKDTDELIVNEIVQLSKMNAFDTQHATYKVAKGSESKSHAFKINDIEYNYVGNPLPELEGINKLALSQKPDFETLCLDYINYQQNYVFASLFNQILPDIRDGDTLDIIQQAYEKLGPETMKALGYRRKAFREGMSKRDKKTKNHQKVRDILCLKPNDVLTLPQAKEKLQAAYSSLQIDGKPTAKNLEDYYCITSQKIKHPKTGKRVDGIVIGASKVTNFKL